VAAPTLEARAHSGPSYTTLLDSTYRKECGMMDDVVRDQGEKLAHHVSLLERSSAALLLVVVSPVLLLGGVAIRLTSRGPALYRAQRMGRQGVVFTMFKLRTMRQDTDQRGAITARRDNRITRVGRLLRSLKLDELPQLINVVRGEMSFFGPRPEAVEIVRDHYAPWMRATLDVPPGIVGPGSLSYFLDEASLPKTIEDAETHYIQTVLPRKIARELLYVERRTIGYRIELALRTLFGILHIGSAYVERAIERENRAADALLAAKSAS